MIKDELKLALCQFDKHPVTRSSQLIATDRRNATETKHQCIRERTTGIAVPCRN